MARLSALSIKEGGLTKTEIKDYSRPTILLFYEVYLTFSIFTEETISSDSTRDERDIKMRAHVYTPNTVTAYMVVGTERMVGMVYTFSQLSKISLCNAMFLCRKQSKYSAFP